MGMKQVRKRPAAVRIKMIEGGTKQALRFARNWLSEERGQSVGWIWRHQTKDGHTYVEVHDGGSGYAYLPGIIEDDVQEMLIDTVRGAVYVEKDHEQLRSLEVEKTDDLFEAIKIEYAKPHTRMQQVMVDRSFAFMSISIGFSIFAAAILFLSVFSTKENEFDWYIPDYPSVENRGGFVWFDSIRMGRYDSIDKITFDQHNEWQMIRSE